MDQELKQRLIGAVVVTALAAIFIPMLFDDPIDDRSQQVSELAIPPTPSVSSGESPMEKAPVSSGQVLNPETSEEELNGPEEEPLQPVEGPDVDDEAGLGNGHPVNAKPKESGAGKKSKPAVAEEDIEVINEEVDPETEAKIDAEVEKLRPKAPPKVIKPGVDAAHAAALKASAEQKAALVKKMAAEAEANRIKSVVKEPAPDSAIAVEPEPVKKPAALNAENAAKQVVKPATVAKPVTPDNAKKIADEAKAAQAKAKRWHIQVGSFGKKENALTLWDSLHKEGFPVSLDTIQTDKGTLYRLKIGADLEGKKAAEIKAKLDAKLNKQNVKTLMISE